MGAFDGRRLYQTPSPPTIRADLIDPETQEFVSFTKDLDPIDAQVIESLWRIRGSGAAVQSKGARFLDTTKLTDQAPTLLESQVRIALRRLLQNGDISLISATADTENDFAAVLVRYTNNRSMTFDRARKIRVRVPGDVNHGQTR